MRSSRRNIFKKSSASQNNQEEVHRVHRLHYRHYTGRCRQRVSATLHFIRFEQILINMKKANVSESWITTLGLLKAAGALGLVAGIWFPWIGLAAAAGLTVFFVGAIITHLRAHDYSFGPAVVFLSLALAALILRAVSL
jgi:hypothetical protein